ncbi:glycosyltransferase family 4 protein [Niabella aquatica]
MKRKIVYCIPSLYNSRGMERVISIKANYLASLSNYEVIIIVTDGRGKPPFFELHPDISVINLDINYDDLYHSSLLERATGYFQKRKQYKSRLSKALHRIKPDITISLLRRDIDFISTIKDGSIKLGEFHFCRPNYRNFTESSIPKFLQKTISAWWMKQLVSSLKKLHKFIVLTGEDKDNWHELDNVAVIGNPLSFMPETASTCTSKEFIAVGALFAEKRFDSLINCWAKVVKRHPEWILRIYGEGMLRGDLQTLINEQGITNNCILEGPTNDILSKYAASSCSVLTSKNEGFPMVIIEAMSCGLPVVSYTCPCGPKDIINDGIDGFLVENGNEAQLVEKICAIIENEEMRKKMGENAKHNVQRFSMENIGHQWEALFDEVLSDHTNQHST